MKSVLGQVISGTTSKADGKTSELKILVVIKLSYLDSGVMKTPKRRFLSFIFACLRPSKSLLIITESPQTIIK